MRDRPISTLSILIAVLLSATTAPALAQVDGLNSLNPLTEQERSIASNRAREAVLALTATPSHLDPGSQIQVLIAQLHVSFGKSAATTAGRFADVVLYDYRDDRTHLAVVDLDNGQVSSMQAQNKQQPALNAWEVEQARSISLGHQPTIDSVKTQYMQATNQSVADVNTLDSSVLVFTRIFAPDQVNALANQCGEQRCAQITFFAPDSIVLDLLVVVNLSQGTVAQLMPFHSSGGTR